nr:hypothetical protein [uncultured Rhodopila sp.]
MAPPELAKAYVADIVATFGGDVHVMPTSGTWTPFQNGAPLKLKAIIDRLDLWAGPMRRLIAAVEQYDQRSE